MGLRSRCFTQPLGSHHQHMHNKFGVFRPNWNMGKLNFENEFLERFFRFMQEIMIN